MARSGTNIPGKFGVADDLHQSSAPASFPKFLFRQALDRAGPQVIQAPRCFFVTDVVRIGIDTFQKRRNQRLAIRQIEHRSFFEQL